MLKKASEKTVEFLTAHPVAHRRLQWVGLAAATYFCARMIWRVAHRVSRTVSLERELRGKENEGEWALLVNLGELDSNAKLLVRRVMSRKMNVLLVNATELTRTAEIDSIHDLAAEFGVRFRLTDLDGGRRTADHFQKLQENELEDMECKVMVLRFGKMQISPFEGESTLLPERKLVELDMKLRGIIFSLLTFLKASKPGPLRVFVEQAGKDDSDFNQLAEKSLRFFLECLELEFPNLKVNYFG